MGLISSFKSLTERLDTQKDELHQLGYDFQADRMLAWRLEKLEKGLEEMVTMPTVHKMIMKLDGLVEVVAIPFGSPAENSAYGRMTIDWGILVTQWGDYNCLRYTDKADVNGFDEMLKTFEDLLSDTGKVNQEAGIKFNYAFKQFKEEYQKEKPANGNTGLLEAEVLGRLLDSFGRKNIMPFGRWMIHFSWKDKHVSPNKVYVIQSAMQKGEGGIQPFYKSKYGEGAGGGKTRES